MDATTRLRLPRPVLLPGWWFELLASVVAAGATVWLASSQHAPNVTTLVTFLVLLIIAENTTLVLSTDSDLFKFLKGITPNGDLVPAQRSGDNR